MTPPEEPPPHKRVLMAAGTGIYLHGAAFAEPLNDLDAVPGALEAVVGALTGLGYENGYVH